MVAFRYYLTAAYTYELPIISDNPKTCSSVLKILFYLYELLTINNGFICRLYRTSELI